MGNLAEYFDKQAYRSTYQIGDRVQGQWNGIPFVGSVGNDRLINLERGSEITVHLDLPIAFQNHVYHVIVVGPKILQRRQ